MSPSVVAALILMMAPLPALTPQDSIREAISRGGDLYYQAEFAKAIDVLLPLDDLLMNLPDPTPEKISVKLYLALSYLGTNDANLAKRYFRELFAVSPQHLLDSQQFAPKVLQLAEEARREQAEMECKRLLDQARGELAAGNAHSAMQLLDRNHTRCSSLNAIARETSEVLFKNGIEAYRKSELHAALDAFRAALRLDSEHELAAHYIELAESKLELDADRLFLTWRRNFDVGAYLLAANDYRRLLPVAGKEIIGQVHSEYRKALSSLIEARARACQRNDTTTVARLNTQASEMLPDPAIAADLLANMGPCRNTNCIEMSSGLALVRLRTRVDPELPSHVILTAGPEPITVNVKARISESGDVMSAEPAGSNVAIHEAVRKAVQLWKFHPAVVRDEARCVDTEIPIVINFEATR